MSTNTDALDAILYSRVSTDDQVESGGGLADQRTRLEGMTAAKGWTATVALVDDGFSAKTLDRPAMTEALRMLAAGEAGALVVTKLDRLTRSVRDIDQLMQDAQDQGWSLVVIDLGIDTTTASGRMVANLMATIAQWEREVIGERTSAALQAKKAQGQRLGRPVALPHSVRERIATERRLGSTYQAIADRLNVDNVPTVKEVAATIEVPEGKKLDVERIAEAWGDVAGSGLWRVSTVAKVCKSVDLDAEMRVLVDTSVLAAAG